MEKNNKPLSDVLHPATTQLLTIEELVLYFKGNYSDKTLHRWRQLEGMPATKIGRRYWFDPPLIMNWIQERFNN